MSPHDAPLGSARSAADLNEAIRELWLGAGGRLTAEERREYQLLVGEWAVAVQRERAAAELGEAA